MICFHSHVIYKVSSAARAGTPTAVSSSRDERRKLRRDTAARPILAEPCSVQSSLAKGEVKTFALHDTSARAAVAQCVFRLATKSVRLVADQGDDHAVEVEEEHQEVEAQLDERFLQFASAVGPPW